MQTKSKLQLLGASLMCLLLTACGGGSGSALDNTLNGGSKNSSSAQSAGTSNVASSGASSSIAPVDSTTLKYLGFGSGNTFVNGLIGVGIGATPLSAGGLTTLTVNLVSGTNTLVTTGTTVTFNSRCIASGEATLSSTTVSTTTGEASTVYTAKGCVGDDIVTATGGLDANNKPLSAQVTLNVLADTVDKIQFLDATPTLINLKGTGGNETSVVRFQVLGLTGAPVKNIDVKLSLSTKVGGLSLAGSTVNDPTVTVKTNAQGYALATVQAGTISTSVRVTATAPSTGATTQSSQLLVSTGIPDQKSMSLAASAFTPIGWGYDGAAVDFTVRLADAFNNFAPDGTTVAFTTEGGAIESGCNTQNGACTVAWRSQNPRPARDDNDESVGRKLCTTLLSGETKAQCEAKRAGRITILATAIGNESFQDVDGDGYFDPNIDIFNNSTAGGDCTANEPISTADVPPGSLIKPCDDLSEAYLDKNESKTRETYEPFIDFNVDGSHTGNDGIYNGALCKTEGAFCNRNKVTIRREATIIMACDKPLADDFGRLPGQPSNISLGMGASMSFNVVLADCNGNSMPAGTSVSLKTDTASDVTITNGFVGSLADGLNPSGFTIFVKASDTKAPSGTFFINVTAGKLTTTLSGISLN